MPSPRPLQPLAPPQVLQPAFPERFVRKGIKKDRSKKTWKKTRKWPEQQLKGRILERSDKLRFRDQQEGYVDMNKIASNFPAIDGIAGRRFRQVKCYLPRLNSNRKACIESIVRQAEELEEKAEKAAERLIANDGELLQVLIDIDHGQTGTKGRDGRAPYNSPNALSNQAMTRHQDVLPIEFYDEGMKQLEDYFVNQQDFDLDALGQIIFQNTVLVVPDDLVMDVQKELRTAKIDMEVEGGGLASKQISDLMDKIGYQPRKQKTDDDDDYG